MTTSSQPPQTSRQMLLRAQEIRELIRDARSAFVPDYVARALRDRFMEPFEEDAEEIIVLLGELADTARRKIEESGIEPLRDEKLKPPRLTKRERDGVANLAMLMGTRSASLLFAGRREEALAEALEAVAWGRTSQDHEVLALTWMGLYAIHERLGRWSDQEGTIRKSLEEARASGNPVLIVEILLPLISYLIEAMRLDEAEELNLEVQSLLEKSIPEEKRHPHYAVSLSHAARIARYRGNEPESIQGLREALRWADGALYPLTRSSILSQLGWGYAHLEQHRQCIECQRELVDLADAIGVDKVKSWAYVNLAESHQNLGEIDQVLELLDHAERYASAGSWDLISFITLRRAEALLAAKRPEEAGALCREIIKGKHEPPRALRLYAALYTLGKAEEQCGRYESAQECYNRAIDVTTNDFPQQISTAQVGVAGTLYALGRHDEAIEMLDRFAANAGTFPSHEAKALRLRARIAEARDDLRTVIDCERRAVDIEKDLLDRKAEQSLRNARIMLETDLLEREAELERERRRRLERELATAVAALGDHTRQAAAIEEQLRQALARSVSGSERVVTAALHEALVSLRNGKHPKESVHHYLAKVDEDFQQRLRERYPNLTRKQERLCRLVRAGLDYKEIASLLDLQPEGLKALRKRLRKRLGLDQEEPLEKFLAEI